MYEFLYKFDTVFYQFLETGTSDITFMGHDQELNTVVGVCINIKKTNFYLGFNLTSFFFKLQVYK